MLFRPENMEPLTKDSPSYINNGCYLHTSSEYYTIWAWRIAAGFDEGTPEENAVIALRIKEYVSNDWIPIVPDRGKFKIVKAYSIYLLNTQLPQLEIFGGNQPINKPDRPLIEG